MRLAKPSELRTHAYPVLTAAISESELIEWFPLIFVDITDPQEAAEPSKGAVAKLETGDYFVLLYGQLSNQVMVRIPTSVNAAAFMEALFREVPLPRGRIVWRREDARLPRTVAAKTIVAPKTRLQNSLKAAGDLSKAAAKRK